MKFPMIVPGLLILSSLSSSACRTSGPASQVKEFTKIPQQEDEGPEEVDFKLSRVADIPQTVMKAFPGFDESDLEDDTFDPWGEDQAYYSVSFGKITKEQFDKLQTTYSKNPKLSYSASRAYELQDFMPPQIQALVNTRFQSETVDTPIRFDQNGKSGSFRRSTLSNCWNTVYEVLRGDETSTSIFYVDGDVIDKFFVDDAYSKPLKSQALSDDWKEVDAAKERNLGLKPFDVILVYGKNTMTPYGLQHIAIYIDDDFYFEKTGPDSRLNYRFTTFDGIGDIYAAWDDAKIEFRRFGGKPIPHIKEAFSYKARGVEFPEGFLTEEYKAAFPDFLETTTAHAPSNWQSTTYRQIYSIVDVPLGYDKAKNRYVLSREAFQKSLRAKK